MTAATKTDMATTRARATVEDGQQALYDAWRSRDEAAMQVFFADRDDLMLWGTDDFERIVGRIEAHRAFASWIASCPPWTSMAPTHRVMDVRADLAWVADEVEAHWERDDARGIEKFRVTTIWEKMDGTWRVVHANIASPH